LLNDIEGINNKDVFERKWGVADGIDIKGEFGE